MTASGDQQVPVRTAFIYLACPGDFDSEEQRESLLLLLDESERDRYERFYFDRNKQEFLVAHGLVRAVLSHHGGYAATEWRFETGEHGRPFVSEPQTEDSLYFNLSHTRELVACLVSDTELCGIDVEFNRDVDDLNLVAQRFFSASEAEDVARCPAADRPDRFFCYWTLKESYIKARGMGLALELASFSFALATPITLSTVPGFDLEGVSWWFHLARPTREHHLALTIDGTDRQVELVTGDGRAVLTEALASRTRAGV